MFYGLGGLTVLLAFLVVTARNAVHSAIFLIGTLMCIAGIFIGLGAEFVAGVQILTYVGGIMVLFLFVIMLINVKEQERTRQTARQWWLAIPIGIALAVIFTFFYYKGISISPVAVPPSPTPVSGNTEQIGWGLYMQYLLPFEIASVLLLVAIIGAVVLAAKRRE
jgi:NADH-quinone oxidoreductase subunit J